MSTQRVEYGVIGINYTVKHIAVKPYQQYGNLVSLCARRYSLRLATMPHMQAKPVCKRCQAVSS